MKVVLVSSVLLASSFACAQQQVYQQCGGKGWVVGKSSCVTGTTCVYMHESYSQCLPGSHRLIARSTSAGTRLPYLAGVNLAGFDFGMQTSGVWTGGKNGGANPPLSQIPHFASQGVNLFRVPFPWQLATPNLGGTLDNTFFARYDNVVQTALAASTKPYVIVEVHNYARWEGNIINQGGPTNEQFANLWTQVAAKYKNEPKVIFGLMNEPHDLGSVTLWKPAVQAAVNAIRAAGATSQFILIPGSTYSSAGTFPHEGGPILISVTDPVGGTDKLIFDVHKYLDSNSSGTHTECVEGGVGTMKSLNAFLKANGNRQAILSETGGGSTASCATFLKNELAYIKSDPSNLAGFAIWSAGAFSTNYELSATPNPDGTDQPIWIQAVRPNLPGN